MTETLPKVTVVYRKRAQRVCRVCFTRKTVQAQLKRTRIEVFRGLPKYPL